MGGSRVTKTPVLTPSVHGKETAKLKLGPGPWLQCGPSPAALQQGERLRLSGAHQPRRASKGC